jgi:hypothetical protein
MHHRPCRSVGRRLVGAGGRKGCTAKAIERGYGRAPAFL